MEDDSLITVEKKSQLSSDEYGNDVVIEQKQETTDSAYALEFSSSMPQEKLGSQFGAENNKDWAENEVSVSEIEEFGPVNEISTEQNQPAEEPKEDFEETGVIDVSSHLENKKNMKQETDGKKQKRPRKKGKGSKKWPRTNENEKGFVHMVEGKKVLREKISDGSKFVYTRKDMEALKYVGVDEQKKKWTAVYCGLGPVVGMEYDALVYSNHQNGNWVDFDPRRNFLKDETAVILGGEAEQLDIKIDTINHMDPACGVNGNDLDGCPGAVEDCNDDDDSDEDFTSIQRPALLVTGEPNFDSGPPEDGLEFIRRVRWETEHIPRVKVAKVEKRKLKKEQTIYMPQIPDIVACPVHLMPLKQWEDVFLADFSELRLALSNHESSGATISGELHSVSLFHEPCLDHLLESLILEKIDILNSDTVDSSQSDAYTIHDISNVDENGASSSASSPKSSVDGVSSDWPSLRAILGMDSVARVSMLRKRVNSVENMNSLSRNDCAWLFALCAAVSTPLDADTCASLRCLLRKCASLRAGKSELDDEVVMLNVLATISGKYFRQSEE